MRKSVLDTELKTRISRESRDELQRIADEQKRSLAALVRIAVEEKLVAYQNQKEQSK